MAKEIKLKDILTKITNVFKTDMYVVNNQICIGGSESEESTPGTFICILSPEATNVMKKEFPDKEVVMFNDIKKAKTELEKYSHIVNGKEAEDIRDLSKELFKIVKNIKSWTKFIDDKDTKITEEDIISIIKDGQIKNIFEEMDSRPTVPIGKSFLPLVTTKNIDDINFSYIKENKDTGLHTLLMELDTDFFQIYNIIYMLNV